MLLYHSNVKGSVGRGPLCCKEYHKKTCMADHLVDFTTLPLYGIMQKDLKIKANHKEIEDHKTP